MSMRKLLESMARLDTAESKPIVSKSAKTSFLKELSQNAVDNGVKYRLAEQYQEFKQQPAAKKHRLEQVLEQVEQQFGEIGTRRTNVTNKALLDYLLENHHHQAFNILHTLVSVKLHQINGIKLDESTNVVNGAVREIFSMFSSYSTGNETQVGDQVSIISLTAWGTGADSVDIEGFIRPQPVEHITADVIYAGGQAWPYVTVIDQLKIKRQVIIFKDPAKAEECLGVLLLLGNKYRNFTIHNDITESIDEAMNPAVATASMKMAAPKVSAVATPSAPAAPNAPKAPGTPAAPTATAPASSAAKPNPSAPVQVEPEQPDMQIGSTQAKDLLNTVAPIMQDPAGAQQLKTLADKFKLKPGVIK